MASRFRGGGAMSLKPENSLKRAEELIGVGQKENALQTLHDTITNKRQQRNWTKALEQVMLRYVDLCVDMRAGRKCKDALINYRNSVQSSNVASLETVVNHLLDVATAKAEEARATVEAEAGTSELADVADLEAASPEELALSYVSGERDADRTDRAVATPWFRFLWECYRTVLDVMRNNSRLEALYSSSAHRAFAFCRQHQRGAELRRLCDVLRNHLTNLLRYRDNAGAHRTDLTKPASWELAIGLRFEALRSACDLELWAEAFRCVEDVQALLALAPRGSARPRGALMAAFYTRLVLVFGRSGSRLYHAYAWYRLFGLAMSSGKQPTPSDVEGMAANVVLAALAVEPYDVQAADQAAAAELAGQAPGSQNSRNDRAASVAALLGFPTPRAAGARGTDAPVLSRAALLAEIERKGLLTLVPPAVRRMHAALEGELDPLALCSSVEGAVAELPALSAKPSPACPAESLDLEHYAAQLREVALLRAASQASRVYSQMRISALAALTPALEAAEVERLVVEAVRGGYLRARFNHAKGTVTFGVGSLADERARNHCALLARRLRAALEASRPRAAAAAPAGLAAAVAAAREAAAADNAAALARKELIEKRKEEAERVAHEREREAEEQRAQAEAQAREQEARRMAAERAKREAERLQRELEEREQAELKAVLASQGKRAPKEGERLDARAVNEEVFSEQRRLQAELQKRLVRVARSQDHLVRACREEEAPLRLKVAERRAKEFSEAAVAEAEAAEANRKAAWARDLKQRDVFAALLEDRRALADGIRERREAEFEERRQAALRIREERRQAAHTEAELARRREFVRRCRIRVEEARRQAAEEEQRIELERARKEHEEELRRTQEQAERRRQREAEIEAKAKEAAAARSSYVPPSQRARAGGAAPAPAGRPAPYAPSRPLDAPGSRPALFGAARPVDASAPASRPALFGAARPVDTSASRPAPLGAARPADAAAAPTAAPKPKSNPFGAARPKADPFGGARPVDVSAPAAAPAEVKKPAPGKFVPRHLRESR